MESTLGKRVVSKKFKHQALNFYSEKKEKLHMGNQVEAPKFDNLLEAVRSSEIAAGGAVQNLPWPFCILYNGQPYQSQVIAAPDPDSAAITANQFVEQLNLAAQSLGFPPLFSVTSGSCPTP